MNEDEVIDLRNKLRHTALNKLLPDLAAVAEGRAFGETHGWHELKEQATIAIALIGLLEEEVEIWRGRE